MALSSDFAFLALPYAETAAVADVRAAAPQAWQPATSLSVASSSGSLDQSSHSVVAAFAFCVALGARFRRRHRCAAKAARRSDSDAAQSAGLKDLLLSDGKATSSTAAVSKKSQDDELAPADDRESLPEWQRGGVAAELSPELRARLPRASPSRLAKYRGKQGEIHHYAPGEGYGSNVIPFAGVAIKRGHQGRVQAQEYIDRAREIGEAIQQQREAVPEQVVPVPANRIELLRLDDIRRTGCEVELETDAPVDAHGVQWAQVTLRGEKPQIQAASLELISMVVPAPAPIAS
eukprot:TRINITY_DN101614_c0_g1_i1.p1 TRINITY_DN101614_c0_g1~~TRINITY_DN101614_c0_g1_i1.p1  ORF type:complete len:291 (-),score=62.26 TRINITY_DN101614_c0_g1_i1:77-949(-)